MKACTHDITFKKRGTRMLLGLLTFLNAATLWVSQDFKKTQGAIITCYG